MKCCHCCSCSGRLHPSAEFSAHLFLRLFRRRDLPWLLGVGCVVFGGELVRASRGGNSDSISKGLEATLNQAPLPEILLSDGSGFSKVAVDV